VCRRALRDRMYCMTAYPHRRFRVNDCSLAPALWYFAVYNSGTVCSVCARTYVCVCV
jgi:hypothetical protein